MQRVFVCLVHTMRTIYCPIKINLTLRILGQRADGYHELRSLVWKKTGSETISICKSNATEIDVDGAKIDGKNLLSTVLEFAAEQIDFPELKIKIHKKYPQGSGIGAGSGNAAALLLWLGENYGLKFTAEQTSKIGADVAVLTQSAAINRAKGIGEQLAPVAEQLNLHWLLLFPSWSSNTTLAYKKLDKIRTDFKTDTECEQEARGILSKLAQKQKVGLLPNDFLLCAEQEHSEYAAAFKIAEEFKASAWGMCGSGSAMFFLSENSEMLQSLEERLKKEKWTVMTEILN